jgi:hypothetical protein
MKKQDDYLSNHYDSDPTAHHGAVGGSKKEWNKFVSDISLYVKKNFPMMDGKDMLKLAYELNNNYQLENPIKLNPKTATFEKVGSHARRMAKIKPINN